MSADITSLPREHKERFAPNQDLIEQLEKRLQEAREGRLRAMAWAAVYADDLTPDGSTATGWAKSAGTYFAMTHAIQGLHRRWGAYCDDPDK